MFDIRWIRENPESFDTGLARRGLEPRSRELIDLDAERRRAVAAAQEIQTRRNALSKQIGALKAKGDDEAANEIITQVAKDKDAQSEAEAEAKLIQIELDSALADELEADAQTIKDAIGCPLI